MNDLKKTKTKTKLTSRSAFHFIQNFSEIISLRLIEMFGIMLADVALTINSAQTEKAIRIATASVFRMIVIQQRNDVPIEILQYAAYNDAHILIAAQHACQRRIMRLLMYC